MPTRGNRYARGGDPMKTRSERRKERKAKVAKSARVIRLRKRLGRIAAAKSRHQQDDHMTALMESYILRRKEERAAQREKEEAAAAIDQHNGDEEMEHSSRRTSSGVSGRGATASAGRAIPKRNTPVSRADRSGGNGGKPPNNGQHEARKESSPTQRASPRGNSDNRQKTPLTASKKVITRSLY